MGRKSQKNRGVSCEVLVRLVRSESPADLAERRFGLRCVEAAFSFCESSRAAGPRIFSRVYRARALHATDTGIILVLKRGVGQLPPANVLPYALA
jgi:hypothetical protein